MRIIVIGLAILAQGLSSPAAADSTNDVSVQKWIVAALRNAQGFGGHSTMGDEIEREYSVEAVRLGWARLKVCRDLGASLDLNLAAAEHYLYARSEASESGDIGYRKMPKFYESLKTWATKADMENWLKQSDQPVSPVSSEVTQWGERGVETGLKDFEVREKKKPSAMIDSFGALMGFAYYHYVLPTSVETGRCTVSIS